MSIFLSPYKIVGMLSLKKTSNIINCLQLSIIHEEFETMSDIFIGTSKVMDPTIRKILPSSSGITL